MVVETIAVVVAEKLAGVALEVAARAFVERLKEVKQNKTDADRAAEYALIARDIMVSLKAEYDRILGEAKWCDLKDRDNVRRLGLRVSYYLRVDALRPILREAVAGFGASVNRLSANNYGIFSARPNLDVVVAECRRVVGELTEALASLEVAFQPGITGFGAEFLMEIESFLFVSLNEATPNEEVFHKIIGMAQQNTEIAKLTRTVSDRLDALLALYP